MPLYKKNYKKFKRNDENKLSTNKEFIEKFSEAIDDYN